MLASPILPFLDKYRHYVGIEKLGQKQTYLLPWPPNFGYSSLHDINDVAHSSFTRLLLLYDFLLFFCCVDGTFIRLQTLTENEPDYI